MSDNVTSISLSEFERDGYVAIKPLFDSGTMLEINQNVNRFIQDVVPTMPETQVYYEKKEDKSTLKQLQQIFNYDAYFKQLMNKSVIREIAGTLLQDDVVPINMQYFNKPAGIGQITPPHQDGYYFHLTHLCV